MTRCRRERVWEKVCRRHDVSHPNMVRVAKVELDNAMATALLALETYVAGGARPAVPNLEGMMDAFERSVAAGTNVSGETAAPRLTECLALYRVLIATIKRLSSEHLNAGEDGHEIRGLAVQSD